MAMNDKHIRSVVGRWGKWAAGGIVIAVLLYLAFVPSPLAVDGREVTRGRLDVSVTAEGKTRIRDIFTVSAPVNGRLRRVTLDPGDPVVAGETMVAIFEPSAPDFLDRRSAARSRARLDQAKAVTARVKADRTLARLEWERAKALTAGTAISQRDRDRRRAELDAAEAAYQAATAELAAAQAELIVPTDEAGVADAGCCLRMAAPISGQVLRVMQQSERVMAVGAPILELGDPRNLEIVVDLLSQDAVRVRAGQPARIENWGGPGDLNGTVRRVEPSGFTKVSALGVEEQRVNVIIDPTDPPARWDSLRDAYRVEPRIIVWSSSDVLTVPLGALFRSGGNWAVYRVEDGRAMLRRVQIGVRNTEAAQVIKGLKQGDVVISHPSEDVSDGRRVSVRTVDGA
ncbi:efflux RND transporter periplasmic adaptor subunit [Emcibacter sp. SYSU 3D8]|uniref:efflux RND transporter periplasmic adaptor subunit n=1 Tax=Emcibacter sp. SYSU 3D8 TaxID=3133969 RepID=UPI0031FF3BCD